MARREQSHALARWHIPAVAVLVFSFIDLTTGFCAACRAYGLWYRMRGG